MKALLISEKPDLMRQIQDVYNKHKKEIGYEIEFTSQRGHLLTSLLPEEIDPNMKKWCWENLPFYPQDHGGFQYKIIDEKKQGNFLTSKERYAIIKQGLDSGKFDFVIHAGDPDQEGELLVNMVLSYAKNKLPVKRFWTNDLTEAHVLHALQNLRDDDKDPMLKNLLSAAYSRQHWDYIFGMNISRGASIQMHSRAACGRVKTVLLNIVVQRENEIKNFVPSTEYGVKAVYSKGFEGTLFNAGNVSSNEYADEDQRKGTVYFKTKKEADDFIKSLGKQAKVVSVNKKHTSTYAPKLFKLSTLQVSAGKNGIKDDTTLKVIQGLYEKQILSYPRTDCEYLSSDEDFENILRSLNNIDELKPYIAKIDRATIEKVRHSKKWINDKALQESGHSALKPTTQHFDFDSLSPIEKTIYMMIARRFVAMFLPPLEQDIVEIVTDVNGNTFKSNGKTTTSKGFSEIFKMNVMDTELPVVRNGEVLDVASYKINEKTTTCPSRFTSPDLIAVCENPAKYLNDTSLKTLGKKLKIGTPATRSGIIRQLATPADKRTDAGQKGDGYLTERKEGKRTVLVPTLTGTNLIENLHGLMITKVDMTGVWEERLEDVRSGKKSAQQLDAEMKSDFEKMLMEIKGTQMKTVGKSTTTIDCKCPNCGGQMRGNERFFYCENYKKDDGTNSNDCHFLLGRTVAGANISEADLIALCTKGETKAKKFTSKAGKKFNASLIYNKEGKKVEFKFADNSTTMKCPVCGKPVVKFVKGYKCSDDSCGFIVWDKVANKKISDKQLQDLITKGQTSEIKGFKSKAGKDFNATLVLDSLGKVKFQF
mgnify:FL=1